MKGLFQPSVSISSSTWVSEEKFIPWHAVLTKPKEVGFHSTAAVGTRGVEKNIYSPLRRSSRFLCCVVGRSVFSLFLFFVVRHDQSKKESDVSLLFFPTFSQHNRHQKTAIILNLTVQLATSINPETHSLFLTPALTVNPRPSSEHYPRQADKPPSIFYTPKEPGVQQAWPSP